MEAHLHAASRLLAAASQQLRWLFGGFALGFLVAFVFAGVLDCSEMSTTASTP